MTDPRDPNQDDLLREQLDPALYAALGDLGWRLPRTIEEVRAAEKWVREHGQELPASLLGQTLDSALKAQRQENERRLER